MGFACETLIAFIGVWRLVFVGETRDGEVEVEVRRVECWVSSAGQVGKGEVDGWFDF